MRRGWLALTLSVVALSVVALALVVPARAQVRTAWLTEVAERYRAWGRVDDRAHWAPWDCLMPLPAMARVSRDSGGPHDRKLYFVYASDRDAYVRIATGGTGEPPVGLTVVKEAYHPRALDGSEHLDLSNGFVLPPSPYLPVGALPPERMASDLSYRPAVDEAGRLHRVGDPGGLFVLRYVGRRRGTDEGWVYGTVDAEGHVTSSGVVESCAGCHRVAPHGHLFGLPDDALTPRR
ncbi:MAG: hypothetical protein AB7S26_21170 [Sandaracinaceae bacterium]